VFAVSLLHLLEQSKILWEIVVRDSQSFGLEMIFDWDERKHHTICWGGGEEKGKRSSNMGRCHVSKFLVQQSHQQPLFHFLL
jgi:hypothetical protein